MEQIKQNKEEIAERIIVALDFAEKDELNSLLQKLKGRVKFVKVGMELFYSQGPSIIKELKSQGLKIFLDLKLHDIPTTVKKSISALAKLELDIINIHACGGIEMMKQAQEALTQLNSTAKLIAVTQLTSTSNKIMNEELLIEGEIADIVTKYAANAKKAGLAGVVASPMEVAMIKDRCDKEFLTITPGVRPKWDSSNDHKRRCTPKQAFENGTDFIVIGRTITQAKDPAQNFDRIIDEITKE